MTDSELLSIEEIHKEIDLIQSCIKRMTQNSFLIKGWSVTFISGLIALLSEKVNSLVIVGVVIFAICSFWYLDSFFLKTEHLYRLKYEWVIQIRKHGDRCFLYDLNPNNKEMWLNPKTNETSLIKSMFSKTLITFYGIPFALSVGFLIFKILQSFFK